MSPSILMQPKSHDGIDISCIDRLLEDYTYILSRAKEKLNYCRYPGGVTGTGVSTRSDRISCDLIWNCACSVEVRA